MADPSIRALAAATHALRSYQYGNAAPDLAEGVADACEKVLADNGVPIVRIGTAAQVDARGVLLAAIVRDAGFMGAVLRAGIRSADDTELLVRTALAAIFGAPRDSAGGSEAAAGEGRGRAPHRAPPADGVSCLVCGGPVTAGWPCPRCDSAEAQHG